jgi:hypothetical protein
MDTAPELVKRAESSPLLRLPVPQITVPAELKRRVLSGWFFFTPFAALYNRRSAFEISHHRRLL